MLMLMKLRLSVQFVLATCLLGCAVSGDTCKTPIAEDTAVLIAVHRAKIDPADWNVRVVFEDGSYFVTGRRKPTSDGLETVGAGFLAVISACGEVVRYSAG
jgi:hypothetical protein